MFDESMLLTSKFSQVHHIGIKSDPVTAQCSKIIENFW